MNVLVLVFLAFGIVIFLSFFFLWKDPFSLFVFVGSAILVVDWYELWQGLVIVTVVVHCKIVLSLIDANCNI